MQPFFFNSVVENLVLYSGFIVLNRDKGCFVRSSKVGSYWLVFNIFKVVDREGVLLIINFITNSHLLEFISFSFKKRRNIWKSVFSIMLYKMILYSAVTVLNKEKGCFHRRVIGYPAWHVLICVFEFIFKGILSIPIF